MNPDAREPARRLAEHLGLVLEAIGVPRMAGRVLGWMLLAEEEEVSLEELTRALDVSKASISHATRLLEQLGVLERVARPGTRQAYFRLSDDPWGAMLVMERRLSEGFVQFAERAGRELPEHPLRHARLAEMREAFELYLEMLAGFIERWKRRKEQA
ncbi:GbsR/MarR family transcriptional regulator [Oceanithermus sp.]